LSAACSSRAAWRRAPGTRGWITAGTIATVEDDCIRRAAGMQAELGLKGVTDGEFRRGSWHMDFLYQIGGVAKTDRVLNIQFKNDAGTLEFSPAAHRVAGKLSLDKTIFGEDLPILNRSRRRARRQS
jgi:5-methyltetrahydropteroyltriglutamate--homocysteine methyltransferase